jgi:hypothetical protein
MTDNLKHLLKEADWISNADIDALNDVSRGAIAVAMDNICNSASAFWLYDEKISFSISPICGNDDRKSLKHICDSEGIHFEVDILKCIKKGLTDEIDAKDSLIELSKKIREIADSI